MVSSLDSDLWTMGDPLLEFGAVVALASDRYGSLPYVDGEGAGSVRSDLWILFDRLQQLGQHLGTLDSYHDFAFLMDHMTGSMRQDVVTKVGLQPLESKYCLAGQANPLLPRQNTCLLMASCVCRGVMPSVRGMARGCVPPGSQ